MQWQSKCFAELDTHVLFALLKARVDVFVVEQQCPYPELDSVDTEPKTVHVFLQNSEEVYAYARVYHKSEHTCAIGRVLVAQSARGKGLAKPLMDKALEVCQERFHGMDVVISAQTYLLPFYTSIGFVSEGEVYLEDGIAHQDMRMSKGA